MISNNEFAPWDYYPKTLLHKEIQNPFSVLADFFSCDLPKEHRKQLKKWMRYATGDDFYNHKRFGPGNLVHTYKLNLRFIEAMYLLLLEYKLKWRIVKPNNDQLNEEKSTWIYFPKNLSDVALLDPFIAVKKIFNDFSLPQYRDHLNECFEQALSIRTTAETMDPGEVITVYENIIKLYSAGWVCFQRNTGSPYLLEDCANTKPVVAQAKSKPVSPANNETDCQTNNEDNDTI